MENKQAVLMRVVLSLLLLLLAILTWIPILAPLPPAPLREWFAGISSGLLVLGLAGIWVSFLAERQAAKTITASIDARFSILGMVLQAGISNVYYCDPPADCRDDSRFRQRVHSELQKAKADVRILGIAAREFLHRDRGFAFRVLETFIKENHADQPKLKVLVVHPLSEQAVSRALREDRDRTWDEYEHTMLWKDVDSSCTTLVDWLKKGYSVEARLYKVFPACFLLFVNDVVFVEQYHFGTGDERASGKYPILEVAKGGQLYAQLEGHFQYVWDSATQYAVDEALQHSVRELTADVKDQFKASIRFARPDIFKNQT